MPDNVITGTINPVGNISGGINESATISGSISSEGTINGTLSSSPNMPAEVLIFNGDNPPDYSGDYFFTSDTESDMVIDTGKKRMTKNITIRKIPYYETSNPTGTTIYIGE